MHFILKIKRYLSLIQQKMENIYATPIFRPKMMFSYFTLKMHIFGDNDFKDVQIKINNFQEES